MTEPYRPHGAAMLDHHRGLPNVMLECVQDGERDDVPASYWFREVTDAVELEALSRCRGRVLDLGAGAGIHTLLLQAKGLEVVALDLAPECATIMREKGVRHAEVGDLFTWRGGPFDTVICLCNGLDKVGRLEKLPAFFSQVRSWLAPGGQVLVDSFDMRVGASPQREALHAARAKAGRYFGEMDIEFAYRGVKGEPFSVLMIDPETLEREAKKAGWSSDVLWQEGGRFLARLQVAKR